MTFEYTRTLIVVGSLLAVACGDDDTTDDTDRPDPMDAGSSDAGTADGGSPAEPRGMDDPPTLGAQLDRAGRPAISTATVGTFMPDGPERDALQNGYNQNSDPATWGSTYAEPIAAAIAILDGADTTCGNQLGYDDSGGVASAYAFLAGVLADDRLIIDSSTGACPEYLGFEAEVLGVVPEGGCGGRSPTVDAVDRSYSVLINGSLGDLGDGVDTDDAAHGDDTFPFLADPS